MQDWKGIGRGSGEVNSTKAFVRNDETSLSILQGRFTRALYGRLGNILIHNLDTESSM
jgi:hypothetical protein